MIGSWLPQPALSIGVKNFIGVVVRGVWSKENAKAGELVCQLHRLVPENSGSADWDIVGGVERERFRL